MSPAEEVRAAAKKIREFGKPIPFGELQCTDISGVLADWLDDVGDDMDDEHAHVIDHPEWIGLAEDLRWGVFAYRYGVEIDSAPWKTALLTARAINSSNLTDELTSKCEAPQSDGCPNPPTHIAEYYTGTTANVGGKTEQVTRRIHSCASCIDTIPFLAETWRLAGAR